MKGQTQPVVLVLITSVVVGSVTTVYVWGEPLLDKGQSQAEIQNLEQDALDLHHQIIQVAESGEGSSETIEIGEGISTSDSFELSINQDQNYIEISERTQNSPYPLETWTTIEGRNLQNLTITEQGSYAIEGQDLPGVVAVNPRGTEDDQQLSYRVDFRNMLASTPTGNQLERIDLETDGRASAADSATLVITNEGERWERGEERVELPDGERLDRKNTEVSIDLR